MKTEIPRGLRNNNPGNIRINSDRFQGEISPSQDRSFKQFENMAYGYRAMFRILRNYYNNYKLTTLRGWISRWAPENENNTTAYVNSVAKYISISPDQPIDINNKSLLVGIVSGMSAVENGVPANKIDVELGYDML